MGTKLDANIGKMFNISQDYLDSFKSVQALVCPPPGMNFTDVRPGGGIANVTGYMLVPNFKASNWVEGGGVTVQQIQLQLMNQGVNWTSCPLDRPFLINGSQNCQACPSETPIYNLTSTQCTACPKGLIFSDAEKKCVETCCPNGRYYNFNVKACLCPQAQPF